MGAEFRFNVNHGCFGDCLCAAAGVGGCQGIGVARCFIDRCWPDCEASRRGHGLSPCHAGAGDRRWCECDVSCVRGVPLERCYIAQFDAGRVRRHGSSGYLGHVDGQLPSDGFYTRTTRARRGECEGGWRVDAKAAGPARRVNTDRQTSSAVGNRCCFCVRCSPRQVNGAARVTQ